MYDYERDRLCRLRSLLDDLIANSAYKHPAKVLRQELEPEIYQAYRRLLEDYRLERRTSVEAQLPSEAEEYWDAFKRLYRQSGLARTRKERDRLYNGAQDLWGTLEGLDPSVKAYFREARVTDKQWADPVGRLGWEFLVIKDPVDLNPVLANVENFTQVQFLQRLVSEAEDPVDTAAVVANAEKLTALAKRLAR